MTAFSFSSNILCPSCRVVSGGWWAAHSAHRTRSTAAHRLPGRPASPHAADIAWWNGILRGPGALGSPSSADFRYDICTVTRPKATVLYETATYPEPLDRRICAGVCPIHCLSDLVRCG